MTERLALLAARFAAGALLVFLALGGMVLWCTLLALEGADRLLRRT